MKINKLKLMSAVSGIFIFFNSCSEDDGAAEIFEEINATLPGKRREYSTSGFSRGVKL